MIRECAALLEMYQEGDLRLILGQHGFRSELDPWSSSIREDILAAIKDAPDSDLASLHTYATGKASGGPPGSSPWTRNDQLRLFCSHLAAHRDLVGEVERYLESFGVKSFVAHDSIEPSREWQAVIESALDECDAMIVFLHDGFDVSRWCDQEVGWALGRRRPVLPLNLGLHPYGFLGKLQDQPCVGRNAFQISRLVMEWLSKTPSLHASLAGGLVEAFASSGSWDFTRSVVPYLERIEALSDDQLSRMETAAKENIDVTACRINQQTGPEWVADYVAKRRGTTGTPILASPDEPPF